MPARAKLNLELEVIRRREDGFHDIRTTFQAIDLHDLLELAPADATSLATTGLDVTSADSVLKAHAAVEEASGERLPTRLRLHKRIPPGSGLGGASSDAAATLRGLTELYRLDLDTTEIAARLGADVPFFMKGGKAVAEGRGERLTQLPPEPAWFAIAWPRIELSTADVYRTWDETGGDAPNQLRRAAERVEPRLSDFARGLGPEWQMTGSGSAFFVRCQTQQEAANQAQGKDCWTAVARAIGPWA